MYVKNDNGAYKVIAVRCRNYDQVQQYDAMIGWLKCKVQFSLQVAELSSLTHLGY